jgi:hypothetical protein
MQFAFRWMNCLLMRELSMPCVVRMWDTYLVRLLTSNEPPPRALPLTLAPFGRRRRASTPSRNSTSMSAPLSSSSGAQSCAKRTSRCVAAALSGRLLPSDQC